MEIKRYYTLNLSWDELCTVAYALSEAAISPNVGAQRPTDSDAFNLLQAVSEGSDSFDGQVARTREVMIARYDASKAV